MSRYMSLIEQPPQTPTEVMKEVEGATKWVKLGGGALLMVGGFFAPGILGKALMGAGGLAAGMGVSDMIRGGHMHSEKPSGTTAAAKAR